MGKAGRIAAVTAALALLGAPASAAGRSHCTASQVRSALVAFTGAFNRGDYEKLDELFAREPAFQWYSSNRPGRRIGAAARRRSTLRRYFEARHRKRDRLGLASFRFNGNSRRWGNFELRARRRSADFRGGRWFTALAKGATTCEGGETQFIVLSFGGPVRR